MEECTFTPKVTIDPQARRIIDQSGDFMARYEEDLEKRKKWEADKREEKERSESPPKNAKKVSTRKFLDRMQQQKQERDGRLQEIKDRHERAYLDSLQSTLPGNKGPRPTKKVDPKAITSRLYDNDKQRAIKKEIAMRDEQAFKERHPFTPKITPAAQSQHRNINNLYHSSGRYNRHDGGSPSASVVSSSSKGRAGQGRRTPSNSSRRSYSAGVGVTRPVVLAPEVEALLEKRQHQLETLPPEELAEKVVALEIEHVEREQNHEDEVEEVAQAYGQNMKHVQAEFFYMEKLLKKVQKDRSTERRRWEKEVHQLAAEKQEAQHQAKLWKKRSNSATAALQRSNSPRVGTRAPRSTRPTSPTNTHSQYPMPTPTTTTSHLPGRTNQHTHHTTTRPQFFHAATPTHSIYPSSPPPQPHPHHGRPPTSPRGHGSPTHAHAVPTPLSYDSGMEYGTTPYEARTRSIQRSNSVGRVRRGASPSRERQTDRERTPSGRGYWDDDRAEVSMGTGSGRGGSAANRSRSVPLRRSQASQHSSYGQPSPTSSRYPPSASVTSTLSNSHSVTRSRTPPLSIAMFHCNHQAIAPV
eukprot:TRINITY_DN22458_c0_g1_i1.p1 TRINITY_DN22458_c0_g1~~TRINITY_DN22458_c0_g1_i1.p1  ORF type:complete len:679 (-),score=51.02 TRINITY_DN22458_c0_g1_i1:286-2031(-)